MILSILILAAIWAVPIALGVCAVLMIHQLVLLTFERDYLLELEKEGKQW